MRTDGARDSTRRSRNGVRNGPGSANLLSRRKNLVTVPLSLRSRRRDGERAVAESRTRQVFDLDNGGTVGFREFVFGLSKFEEYSFDATVKFAYRLFDLDGDGTPKP